MKLFKKILWVFFLSLISFSVIYLLLPEIGKYLSFVSDDKKLSKRIEEEERKNLLYKKEIDNLENNPVYIEKIAREKLGYSRKGEIIYKFSSGEDAGKDVTEE
ncbi:septum formation initiator family protein [Candidatus Auribacterota bacterium]